MLAEFDIINMNGRLYDPVLGRFLSPDNYVQKPDNSQSYNSYCFNNPLKYTDPSGEFWNVASLAALPDACSHATLTLLTFCLSCSIARRTAS